MALKCGIIGLPNVGKSMLFNGLSNGHAASANFPFCTIEPNVGIVSVPDQRIELLATLAHTREIIPAHITFVDIAGLVAGAHRGEGLGNQFLSHIREVDAVVHVVRCFKNDSVLHVAGSIDPLFDKQVIDHELRCKDIETLARRLAKMEKLAKQGAEDGEYRLLKRYLAALEAGKNARELIISTEEQTYCKEWQLLTAKPVIYFANVDEATLGGSPNPYLTTLMEAIAEEGCSLVVGCATLEAQLHGLIEEERQFFLQAYNITTSGLDQLIQAVYALLQYITYFTVGPKEVRAWTIQDGTKAPQAAGVIHSDFQKGFIKAEVISFEDYQNFKSESACRLAGKVRLEGKEYIVQDGDIMLFRFNV